ncbi:MAG: gliding motility-associated-like protein [Saprospiraceae bacterium]
MFTPISCFGANDGSIELNIENINNYTFEWENGETSTMIQNLQTGNYIVTITDSLNCTTLDTIFMDEPTEIISNFEVKNITCFGKNDGELKIQTTGGTPFYIYNFENNGFSSINRFTGLTSKNYEIKTQDAKGCEVVDTIIITEPEPILVDLGDDIDTEIGNQITVNPMIINGIAPFLYIWNSADSLISCADCFDPIITATEAIKRYDFIVTDANGCIGEDFIIIRTNKEWTIFVANAFTPNDDGNNDVLYIQGGKGTTQVNAFQVFDRWGELIFLAENTPLNDANFGWDGTFKGEPMNSGMFIWSVEVQFEDGRVVTYKGSTFLIR